MWTIGYSRPRKRAQVRERDRYDSSSRQGFSEITSFDRELLLVPRAIAGAYREYLEKLVGLSQLNGTIVELGAGRGDYSWPLIDNSRNPIFLDYSFHSLTLLRKRANAKGAPTILVCANAEALPFRSGSVDAIVGVGVLGYVDHDSVTQEIVRALGPSGDLLLCDSVKGNPIFALNRWLRVLRGKRSSWVARNTPSMRTYSRFRERFKVSTIVGYGALSFLVHLLRIFLDEKWLASVASTLDRRAWATRLGFKVVLNCQRPFRSTTSVE